MNLFSDNSNVILIWPNPTPAGSSDTIFGLTQFFGFGLVGPSDQDRSGWPQMDQNQGSTQNFDQARILGQVGAANGANQVELNPKFYLFYTILF